MKYVKCVNPLAVNLTYQKVYEVKRYWISDWCNLTYIIITNDVDFECTYVIHTWFEDATVEIRQNKINQILDD
jgi:hypothetical protein